MVPRQRGSADGRIRMRAFFDFVTIVAYAGTVLRFAMEGRLSAEAAALLLILLVALLAAGHALGTGLVGLIIRVGVPLASAAALILHYSGGDPEAIRQATACFLTLAFMLFGLYVMFRGLFPRRNVRHWTGPRRVHQGFEIRYRRGWW